MDLYPKIQSIYRRTDRGEFIPGEFATPEIAYLARCDWEWTEKVDGTNIRIGIGDDGIYRVGGRTDNAQIPVRLLDAIAALGLEDKLVSMRMEQEAPVCLYGEGYGAKIQKGGGNYRPDQGFVLFDVRVGDWWLKRPNVEAVAKTLSLDVVPIVGHGPLVDPDSFLTAESCVRGGVGSKWGEFEAEGIVCRPVVPLFDRRGNRVIVKLKTKDYRKLAKASR